MDQALLAIEARAWWHRWYEPIEDCMMSGRNGRHKRHTEAEDALRRLMLEAAVPAVTNVGCFAQPREREICAVGQRV